MKVQHHIQHSYIASFSAFLPLEKTLRVGRFANDEYVCGEFGGGRREVFADYYSLSTTKGVAQLPHLDFAKSDTSMEGVLRFTSNWGPLNPNAADDMLLR